MFFADGQPTPPNTQNFLTMIGSITAVAVSLYTVWSGSRKEKASIDATRATLDAQLEDGRSKREVENDERVATHFKKELQEIKLELRENKAELKEVRKESADCLKREADQQKVNQHLTDALELTQERLRAKGIMDDSAIHRALPPGYKKGDSKKLRNGPVTNDGSEEP